MKKQMVLKHFEILFSGFLHALKSTAAVVLLAAGVCLFCCVTIDSGYFAVGKFVAALLAIVISVVLLYSCGSDLQRGKFSK